MMMMMIVMMKKEKLDMLKLSVINFRPSPHRVIVFRLPNYKSLIKVVRKLLKVSQQHLVPIGEDLNQVTQIMEI